MPDPSRKGGGQRAGFGFVVEAQDLGFRARSHDPYLENVPRIAASYLTFGIFILLGRYKP